MNCRKRIVVRRAVRLRLVSYRYSIAYCTRFASKSRRARDICDRRIDRTNDGRRLASYYTMLCGERDALSMYTVSLSGETKRRPVRIRAASFAPYTIGVFKRVRYTKRNFMRF